MLHEAMPSLFISLIWIFCLVLKYFVQESYEPSLRCKNHIAVKILGEFISREILTAQERFYSAENRAEQSEKDMEKLGIKSKNLYRSYEDILWRRRRKENRLKKSSLCMVYEILLLDKKRCIFFDSKQVSSTWAIRVSPVFIVYALHLLQLRLSKRLKGFKVANILLSEWE